MKAKRSRPEGLTQQTLAVLGTQGTVWAGCINATLELTRNAESQAPLVSQNSHFNKITRVT